MRWPRILPIRFRPVRELPRRTLVIGSGLRALDFYEGTRAHPEWGVEVVGFADDAGEWSDPRLGAAPIHKLSDLGELLVAELVEEVVFALPRGQVFELTAVAEVCSRAGVPLTMFADLLGSDLPPAHSTQIGGVAALRFGEVDRPRWALAIKRGIDIAGACIGLCLAAPIMVIAAVGIRVSSPGPVIYWQMRCCRGGSIFRMPKLRTMVHDADGLKAEMLHLNEMDGPVFKMSDDPRTTPIGRWLRCHSLDELPQLWNVLRGEMSLVGPRPPLPSETVHYTAFEHRRLVMRPGLTCQWQVSGPNRHGFSAWMRSDLEYIDNWSLRNDWKILLKTVPVVLRGENT